MPADAPAPDYAFVVHYTSAEDVVATDPGLGGLSRNELRRFCAFMGNFAPGVLMRAPTIRSATGATVNGVILALPLLPEEMARRGRRRVAQEIKRLVDLAGSLGARIVGLGGYTTPYSRRGLEVVGRGPAITTGNALTAGMAIRAIERAAAQRGMRIRDARAAVVGAAGSVGALCARLLAREHVGHLVLIGNPATGTAPLLRLFQQLERDVRTSIEITTDLTPLAACDLIITATTAGHPILETAPLAPGTIICDVARPPDTASRLRARDDLTVIEGGRVALPDPAIRFGTGNLQGLPDGVTLACLAETILLALEDERRDCGVGDNVPLAEVDRVMALARRHGFRLDRCPLAASPTPAFPISFRGESNGNRSFHFPMGRRGAGQPVGA
jgi:predicted amino acid dehydrogenase